MLPTSQGEQLCTAAFQVSFKNCEVRKPEQVTKCSFNPTDHITTGSLNDKPCVNVDEMEDSVYISTCWGSDCFKFHHVLPFTLTESLKGPGKKDGCVLQLICSKCRTCPSFIACFKGRLSVCVFICRIGCVNSGVCSESTYSSLDKKNRLYLFGMEESRYEKGEDMTGCKKIFRGGRRWEGSVSEKMMKTAATETSMYCTNYVASLSTSFSHNWESVGDENQEWKPLSWVRSKT